jgi:hypothetical protein
MSVLTIIKKIGEKIISIVESPIKYADMLGAFIGSIKADYPKTEAALSHTVTLIEGLSPDVIAAIAANGFNLPDDLKAGADIQGLFSYIKDTLFPTIEGDYADFAKDAKTPAAAPAAAAPVAAAVAAPHLSGIAPA